MVESGCKSEAPSELHVSEAVGQRDDKAQPRHLAAFVDNFCQEHTGVSEKRGTALRGNNSEFGSPQTSQGPTEIECKMVCMNSLGIFLGSKSKAFLRVSEASWPRRRQRAVI